ncbi:MAG TPA: sulfur carrier protein ThiS [Gemmatimonadales bacterium]
MIAGLPRLHAVTDDRVIAQGGLAPRAAAMAGAAGPALAVHLRSRALEGGAMLALARELSRVLAPHGSWLVINGRADVARAAGARAVASGRNGLSAADIRRAAPGLLVMRSVHDEAEIRRADGDALIAGAIYETASHPDAQAGRRANGQTDLIKTAAATGRPVIAIGGMTPERVPEVLGAGAFGVAAIRALWDAPDTGAAARAFTGALPQDETVAVMINGAARRARSGISLAGLLGDLGLDARAVVVEHNRRIVRRDALDAASVSEGDAIELVHFVGGG